MVRVNAYTYGILQLGGVFLLVFRVKADDERATAERRGRPQYQAQQQAGMARPSGLGAIRVGPLQLIAKPLLSSEFQPVSRLRRPFCAHSSAVAGSPFTEDETFIECLDFAVAPSGSQIHLYAFDKLPTADRQALAPGARWCWGGCVMWRAHLFAGRWRGV